ncbi:MAG: hypothetical protein JO362_24055 [Streptomycetaceae bacterium]|nr:hypothetical protein [Streptomycetaceae bacterium]
MISTANAAVDRNSVLTLATPVTRPLHNEPTAYDAVPTVLTADGPTTTSRRVLLCPVPPNPERTSD